MSTCPVSLNDDFSAGATFDDELVDASLLGVLSGTEGAALPAVGPDDSLARKFREAERRIAAVQELNKASEQRGRSWAIPVEDGRHSTIPCWSSRRRWTAAVAIAANSKEGRQLCRRRIRPVVLLAVARAMARFADSRTGRGVTASNDTIGQVAAELLGRESLTGRTVCTARWILERMGLAVELERGRYLSAEERLAAAEHHGGAQLRAGSTWSLALPKARSEGVFVLPLWGSRGSKTPSDQYSPKRALTRARRPSAASPRDRAPRDLATQRLVAGLVARTPALDRVQHLGALCRVVEESRVDTSRWTGRDLVEVINADTKRRGWTFPENLENPTAWLRWRLASLDLDAPSPSEIRRELDEEAARRREWALGAEDRRRADEEFRRKQANSPTRRAAMAEIRKILTKRPAEG